MHDERLVHEIAFAVIGSQNSTFTGITGWAEHVRICPRTGDAEVENECIRKLELHDV